MARIVIDARFNGPPGSANGGYAAGLVAGSGPGSDPVRVRLHTPPPLETPMERRVTEDDVSLWWGDTRVASAWSGAFEGSVPAAPSLVEARSATLRYRGHHAHAYPSCFVCGPDRAAGDGLRLFAGPLHGGGLVATTWSPSSVPSAPWVWAALDCPSFFALDVDAARAFLLGEITAAQRAPIRPGVEYVVFGWPRGHEGRKYLSGAAIVTGDGDVLARAEHVWFDVSGPS